MYVSSVLLQGGEAGDEVGFTQAANCLEFTPGSSSSHQNQFYIAQDPELVTMLPNSPAGVWILCYFKIALGGDFFKVLGVDLTIVAPVADCTLLLRSFKLWMD